MQGLQEENLIPNKPKTNNNLGPFLITKEIDPSFKEYRPTGAWTKSENTAYGLFLSSNKKAIEGKETGHLWDIFKQMSQTVQTRNMMQCKSHHQKLSKKYGSVSQIIDELQTQGIQIPFQNIIGEVSFCGEQKIQANESFFKQLSKPLVPVSLKNPQKDNQDLIHTGTSYQDEDELDNDRQEQWRTSMNAIQNSANIMYSMSQWNNFPSQATIQFKPDQKRLQMNKQWVECHNLFLMWTSKMKQLMSQSYED